MKDAFFSTKRYKGTYKTIFPFESYGDTTNYFIELQYICNRDDFQSLQNPKGTSLDFDIKNLNGEGIFADLDASHLTVLEAREYALQTQALPEESSDDNRLVLVKELYVFEPDVEFIGYDSDIVPIWGLQDDTESVNTTIVTGSEAGNVYRNLSGNSIVQVADASQLKTGEYVSFTFAGYWYYYSTATDTWIVVLCNFIPTSAYKILAISGNYVEVEGTISPGDDSTLPDPDNYPYLSKENQDYSDAEYFFNGLNGVGGANNGIGMWASSCTVEKEYSYRAFSRRVSVVRTRFSVHKEVPEFESRFAPSDETGSEYTVISRWTTTTPTEWNTKVEAEAWFTYTEPELSYNSTTGLYELLIKETKCL